MQDRKRKMKSPCEWLWWRNTLSFFSHFNGVLSRVETHKKMGRVLDWEKEFSPQWVSCIVLSRIFCILAARRRFVRVPKVYDTRRLALVNELVEYYAPCKCEESASFEDMLPAAQRRAVQRERSQRWKQRERVAGLWVATPERLGELV